MKTKSKAQLKREKQLRARLYNDFKRRLTNFENDYLGAYVEWAHKEIQNKIDKLTYEIENEPKRLAKALEDVSLSKWSREKIDRAPQMKHIREVYKKKLSRPFLITKEAIIDAANGYEKKFNKLIDKLMEADLAGSRLEIEQLSDAGMELEFLISNDVKEVHARIIFACGEINAPHYRFITTVRIK